MHPNRVWITTSPTEAEKDFHTNKTWISMPTYHFDICKLEEKKNPRRKAILSVAKLMNSTMHLSFTFGDVKFKKYINFKLSCRQYGHIGILLPHNSFGGQQYLWLKKKTLGEFKQTQAFLGETSRLFLFSDKLTSAATRDSVSWGLSCWKWSPQTKAIWMTLNCGSER